MFTCMPMSASHLYHYLKPSFLWISYYPAQTNLDLVPAPVSLQERSLLAKETQDLLKETNENVHTPSTALNVTGMLRMRACIYIVTDCSFTHTDTATDPLSLM